MGKPEGQMAGDEQCGQRASFNRRRRETGQFFSSAAFNDLTFQRITPAIVDDILLAPVLIYYVLMKLRLVVEHDSETKRWAAFFRNYPVAPPQATQRTKRSKTQRKLLNFGLSRRRSICLPAQKSWKLRSRERALPCLHSPTRHSRPA